MHKIKLKKIFSFPLNEKFRDRIEDDLSAYTLKTGKMVCFVNIIFQLVMMISMILRKGGPFATQRRSWYFGMYIFLFTISLLVLIGIYIANKKKKRPSSLILSIGAGYAFFVCFWSSIITLIDQLGGDGITVFSYMMLTMAALTVLKPWQGILIYGSCFLFLNSLLPLFENGRHNLFSNLINGSFVLLSSILISCVFYRVRVQNFYKQIIIEKQYEEIVQINEQLNHLIMVDELTQMNNRRFFEEIIRNRLDKHIKRPQDVSGLMVDIDYFKQYNDKYGHQAGDVCLQKIAKEIICFIDSEDANAVRYGGEEFFICFYDKDKEQAVQKAKDLCNSIEALNLFRDDVCFGKVTVSIGICVEKFPGEIDLMELVHRSDMALYQAKNRGRNCVEVYHATSEEYLLETSII